jgi:two-component system, cell cycle response regulator DivK
MKPNILYIEDNPDNMLLVRRILQSGSYNLIEARNGIDGLIIAGKQNINLILLDINLPDIDGYEVARRIRLSTNPGVAHTPIVAITANAMKGDAEKIFEAGCNVCLTKPIKIEELLKTIEALVGNEVRNEAYGDRL